MLSISTTVPVCHEKSVAMYAPFFLHSLAQHGLHHMLRKGSGTVRRTEHKKKVVRDIKQLKIKGNENSIRSSWNRDSVDTENHYHHRTRRIRIY